MAIVTPTFRPSRPPRRRLCLAWLASAPLAWRAGHAATLVPGALLPTIALEDQHGKPVHVDGSTRRLVYTAERSVGDMVSKLLAAQPAGVLGRLNAVYVADISAMPAFITRMFALPKMRELPFSIALVRDSAEQAQVSDLPRQPGAATVLLLEEGRVSEILLPHNETQLRLALGLPAA